MEKLSGIRNIIYLGLVIIILGCATAKPEPELTSEERAAIGKTPEYIIVEAELDEKRNDDTIYFAEGIVKIGNDYATSREDANQAALEALSSQIKIAIKIDMELIISGESRISGGVFSADSEEKMARRIKTYTSQILSDVKGNKYYSDFPWPNYVTSYVYIDKAKYDEKVKRDLEARKMRLRDTIINGDEAMVNDDLKTALQHWLEAQKLQDYLFDNLPVIGDLNNDGFNEEFSASLSERINRLTGNLILTTDNELYTYDSSGRVNTFPSVYLTYQEDSLNKVAAKFFPLNVSFLKGYGRLPQDLMTDNYGYLALPITSVDSSERVTRIKVEIDKEAFQGLGNNSKITFKSVEIQLEKLRTVAISFAFSNDGRISVPQDMKGSLSSLVLGNELSVLPASVPRRDPTETDFKKVSRSNADYLLLIYTSAGKAVTVGDYENMYNVGVSGVVSLYSLPYGEMIYSESIPAKKGFGTSGDGAGWDGYGQMREDILRLAASAVEQLVR